MVRQVFAQPALAGMDFLNEAPNRYPKAISLASGRPDLAVLRTTMPWLDPSFVPVAYVGGLDRYQQYGPTQGLACDVLADWITQRTGAAVGAGDVLLTTGAQEGMAIALLALCEPGVDALLVPDPTYLGILGIALMLGVDVVSIGPAGGVSATSIEAAAARAVARGRRPRALYLIADYDNPSGDSVPVAGRVALLAAAAELGIVVIEDVAYRELGFGDAPPPSLSASGSSNVLQLGTFAKLVFPGLRLGYLAMPRSPASAQILHACRLAKSFTTLNTATPSQAIVARVLLEERARLLGALRELRTHYLAKRDTVLRALEVSGIAECGATWNVPGGGFFITVHLPFEFGTDELNSCAVDYGAILTPMRYFSLTSAVDRQVRIAYSALTVAELREGVARFGRFVRERAIHTTESRVLERRASAS